MNTEDRLHRAAQEVERVTASLTAPPLGEVRRSARMRGIGVAVATAVGVVVLIGGAVLALNPGGETTIGPANPGETTIATVGTTTTTVASATSMTIPESVAFDGIPVLVPELDPEPRFEMPGAVIDPVSLPEDHVADLEKIRASDLWEEFERIDEIQFIGQVDRATAYVVTGAAIPDELGNTLFSCVLVVDGAPWGVCNYSDDARLAFTNTDLFPSLVGWVGDGVSAVSLDAAGSRIWARTRAGYVFIGARYGVVESLDFTAYGFDGSVVSGLWNFDSVSESSCSGAGIAPSALALSSLPQPVGQTLVEIVEAALACDFDTLETVGGDNFTASFGGDDPSELWTYEEEQGYEPMYWLMSILDLPHGTVETENGTLYVWPAASAHEGDWETTPAADVAVLEPLYSEDQMQGFADFGAYIGYRVGIWEDGDWSFFVVGD
jgi:hypothetical protein